MHPSQHHVTSLFFYRALVAALFLGAGASATFAVEIPFSTARSLGSAVGHASLADIDGDGDLDVVGDTGSDVGWWENDGAWTEHIIGAGALAGSVEAADLDGDGDGDVLATFTFPSEIVWWENTAGDGSSWTKHAVDVGTWATAADFDGDGDLDIASSGMGLVWWENTVGDGSTWTEHQIHLGFPTPNTGVAVDLDRDGDMDIVGRSDTLDWWENTAADGTAWTHRNIEPNTDLVFSMNVADIDGDGDPDVLATTFVDDGDDHHRVGWWENTAGDGTAWTEHNLEVMNGSSRLTPADLDGDGDTDFVRAIFFGAVSWWENLGTGSDWIERTIDGTWTSLSEATVGDVDQDGDVEVLAEDFSNGSFWWDNETLHRNAVFLAESVIDGDFTGAKSVTTADIDGDGDEDVVGGSSSGALSWWENTFGDASAWTEHEVDVDFFEASQVVAADLDGDGDLDVLASSGNSDGVRWWQNTTGDGTIWTERAIAAFFLDALGVRVADLDRDGDLDVLGASMTGGIRWWENAAPLLAAVSSDAKVDGNGTTWTEHTVDGTVEAQSVDTADFDGDGDLDVVAPDYINDTIHWWENTNGAGTAWTKHDIVTGVNGPTEVMARDFNRDGHMDVVGVSELDTEIWRWENDGTGGGWSARIVSLSESRALDVADVDGDGDNDVLGPQAIDERMTWWKNADNGFNWFTHITTKDFLGASSVAATDLDGDGDTDFVGAASTDGDVSWWENVGGQAELVTEDAVITTSVADGSDGVVLLKISARHFGRFGDGDLELASLELLFEEAPGDPLSDAELGALVDNVRVYRDDGDGSFEAGADTNFHTSTAPFTLNAGALTLRIADGNANAQVSFDMSDINVGEEVFFVAVDFPNGAASAVPNSLLVTHLVEVDNASRSVVEMSAADIPLPLTDPQDASSSTVTVLAIPDITVTPGSLDFGRHPITGGSSASMDIVLTNDGSATLTINLVFLGGLNAADFGIFADTGEATLEPGASRTISVTFDPTTTGTKLGNLNIFSDDIDEGFTSPTLSGEATDPEITVNPASLPFGRVEFTSTTAYQDVTITNDGTTDMEITSITLVGADTSSFQVINDTGGMLAAGANRTVSVRFVPGGTEGVKSAQLRILSDDADQGTLDIDLSGEGVNWLFTDGFESGDTTAWSSASGL